MIRVLGRLIYRSYCYNTFFTGEKEHEKETDLHTVDRHFILVHRRSRLCRRTGGNASRGTVRIRHQRGFGESVRAVGAASYRGKNGHRLQENLLDQGDCHRDGIVFGQRDLSAFHRLPAEIPVSYTHLFLTSCSKRTNLPLPSSISTSCPPLLKR